MLTRLDVRLAVSEAARRHAATAAPGNYLVVPNGVDVAAHAGSDRGRGGRGRILFVGRADPRKGLPVLLDAFARLPGSPRLDLVGVDAGTLAALGGPPAGVRALGTVSDAERRRLLGAADVVCAPSLTGESFGLVLVEAMAAGTPVVASAIPGYVEVLPPDAGRLVPPGDSGRLAAALAELLADDALRARLGAAGLAAAWRFDSARVAEDVLAAYDAAMCSASSGRVSRGSKPMRAAISSLDGLVPSTKSARR